MATDSSLPQTDVELLYQYLGRRLDHGGREASIEAILAEFAEYRRELDEVRAKLARRLIPTARGESGPLDLEDIIRRGRERLAAEGIAD